MLNDAAAMMCWLIGDAACQVNVRHVQSAPVKDGGSGAGRSSKPLHVALGWMDYESPMFKARINAASSGQANQVREIAREHHEQKSDDAGSFGYGD